MMTYSEALEYIHSVTWLGSRPGLDRTRELMRRLGNPQNELKFIHIAGTNGKGSTSAMLAEILKCAGYKVGLYTSPFILRFNERMRIDGEDIPDDELAEITEYVRPFANSMEDTPTEFELITAIAFVYFARHKCDYVVLEVGMGGALDSTNIIDTAVLSIITGIAMDHTAFLGDTLEKIAAQKAGIIKRGTPVLLGTQHGDFDAGFDGGIGKEGAESIRRVISSEAKRQDAPFYGVNLGRTDIIRQDLDGCDLSFDGKKYHLSLLGSYQPYNAFTALAACDILRETGLNIPYSAEVAGLERVIWRGRFEILSRQPLIISDGGHNPEGIDAAVRSIKNCFGDKKVNIVSGVMADKDYGYMISSMARVAHSAFTVRPDNPRALDADRYAEEFKAHGVPAKAYPSLYAALEAATQNGLPTVCLGSLYMYGQVVEAVRALSGK
ncbi:MAG: bifunctional folylpolyglutamate synthase/dihydrofolate synthase [Clostridia bacterium]|nr:bifunctional folylpolyglutamate synthase/dihydrofolate synthase [Clostridia bacterium]